MPVNIDLTLKKIEDSVRRDPTNQGKNEAAMQAAIDAAIAASVTATTFNPNYNPVSRYSGRQSSY
jgi:hypothetical protein